VRDLGLVVVDEEHEESYKQADPAPRYHARDVALVRAQREGAAALLVSATPSLETTRLVEQEAMDRISLGHRFGSPWPKITVVDRRREGPEAPFIGPDLARAIEEREERGEGVVLLVTRRGYAPALVCKDCGHRVPCPHCDVSLTHHRTRPPALRCHLCGYRRRAPDLCEECGGTALEPLGAGTQRIEDEVARRFPALIPVRMDSDTTRRPGEHERILRAFARGDAGLLLGTQVVAKGHDFDHVTLVGVVNADTALFQPDFRAAERTFRLLVQAAGRAGRGEQPGEVVIQTLTPTHTVFEHLDDPDVGGFLAEQAELRRMLEYPPFTRMAVLTVAGDDREEVEREAERLAGELEQRPEPLLLRGPAEAHLARVKRRHRQRILLATRRGEDPSGVRLRGALREVLAACEPSRRLARVVDMDPYDVA
jgi:primosomal protein N' (replication factor Y)